MGAQIFYAMKTNLNMNSRSKIVVPKSANAKVFVNIFLPAKFSAIKVIKIYSRLQG